MMDRQLTLPHRSEGVRLAYCTSTLILRRRRVPDLGNSTRNSVDIVLFSESKTSHRCSYLYVGTPTPRFKGRGLDEGLCQNMRQAQTIGLANYLQIRQRLILVA
jgi:hypothetical protein